MLDNYHINTSEFLMTNFLKKLTLLFEDSVYFISYGSFNKIKTNYPILILYINIP